MGAIVVVIAIVSFVLFSVGAAILLSSLTTLDELSHPVATTAVTVVGVFGSAYSIAVINYGKFVFPLADYLKVLGFTTLFLALLLALAAGIIALIKTLA